MRRKNQVTKATAIDAAMQGLTPIEGKKVNNSFLIIPTPHPRMAEWAGYRVVGVNTCDETGFWEVIDSKMAEYAKGTGKKPLIYCATEGVMKRLEGTMNDSGEEYELLKAPWLKTKDVKKASK